MTNEPEEPTPTPEPAATATAAAPPVDPPPPPEPPRPRRLMRSRTDQVIGGVAGGLGNYLDIDPVLIRIAWVALVLFGGTGILLYIIAWIIMPEEDADTADRRAATERPRSDHASAGTSGALILAVVLIGFGTIALLRSIDVNVPSWQLVLASALGLVGLALVLQARDGLNGGLVAIGVILSVILAGVGGVNVGVNIDADYAFSDNTETPRTAASLEDSYSVAFGSLTFDLGELDLATLPPGTTRVELNAAFGSIAIEHGGLPVRVDTSSVFGSGEDYESPEYDEANRRILIEVSTAFGSSEVGR